VSLIISFILDFFDDKFEPEISFESEKELGNISKFGISNY
jgi:hypothetical protein